jgi:hypothetical protein
VLVANQQIDARAQRKLVVGVVDEALGHDRDVDATAEIEVAVKRHADVCLWPDALDLCAGGRCPRE